MVKLGLTEGKNAWRIGAYNALRGLDHLAPGGRLTDPGHRPVVPLALRGVCYRVVAAREGLGDG